MPDAKTATQDYKPSMNYSLILENNTPIMDLHPSGPTNQMDAYIPYSISIAGATLGIAIIAAGTFGKLYTLLINIRYVGTFYTVLIDMLNAQFI